MSKDKKIFYISIMIVITSVLVLLSVNIHSLININHSLLALGQDTKNTDEAAEIGLRSESLQELVPQIELIQQKIDILQLNELQQRATEIFAGVTLCEMWVNAKNESQGYPIYWGKDGMNNDLLIDPNIKIMDLLENIDIDTSDWEYSTWNYLPSPKLNYLFVMIDGRKGGVVVYKTVLLDLNNQTVILESDNYLGNISWSPTEKKVVYYETYDDYRMLSLQTGENQSLTGVDGDHIVGALNWSENEDFVLMQGLDEIFIYQCTTDQLTATGKVGFLPTWMPGDEKFIYFKKVPESQDESFDIYNVYDLCESDKSGEAEETIIGNIQYGEIHWNTSKNVLLYYLQGEDSTSVFQIDLKEKKLIEYGSTFTNKIIERDGKTVLATILWENKDEFISKIDGVKLTDLISGEIIANIYPIPFSDLAYLKTLGWDAGDTIDVLPAGELLLVKNGYANETLQHTMVINRIDPLTGKRIPMLFVTELDSGFYHDVAYEQVLMIIDQQIYLWQQGKFREMLDGSEEN